MPVVFTVRGVGEELVVFEDKLTITPKGILGTLSKGLKGTKIIPFSSITAIQHRDGGIISGYLQFTLAGGVESRGGAFAAASDENTFMYGAALNAKMREIKNYIERRCEEIRNPTPPPYPPTHVPSSSLGIADQLTKLADLKERGLLSDEEFAKAKSQILQCANDVQLGSPTSHGAPTPAAPIEKVLRRQEEPSTLGGPIEKVLRRREDTPPPPAPMPRQSFDEHQNEGRAHRRIGTRGMIGIALACIVFFAAIVLVLGPSNSGTHALKAEAKQSPSTTNVNAPVGFRAFKWGVSPSTGLKKISGPTDGVIMYGPAGKPVALYGLPVAEEAYSFSKGKFYSGSAWLDGRDNFTKVKAALTKEFGPTSFANETTKVWKWKWPNTKIEVTLSYQERFMRTTVRFENMAI